MPLRIAHVPPEFEAFRQDMLRVLDHHAGHLTSSDMLSVAAYAVGQIVAMQDKNTMSMDDAMTIIFKNIERGNHDMVQARMGEAQGTA